MTSSKGSQRLQRVFLWALILKSPTAILSLTKVLPLLSLIEDKSVYVCAPNWRSNPQYRFCPDQGSNPQPFGVWDDTPTNGGTWWGQELLYFYLKNFLNLLILQREKEEGRERETLICCPTYLCIRCLFLACALTKYQTHNLSGVWDDTSQLSYPARQGITLNLKWAFTPGSYLPDVK